MREPDFWYRGDGGWPRRALMPVGWLYGRAVRARFAVTTPWYAPIPVICVGNPGLGGGGKTPTVLAVAARLTAMGESPHCLSRGYGGREAGPLTVDTERHQASDVGDEPLLLAKCVPTHIAGNRRAGAAHAAKAGASVIVMDDGYQNPTVAKSAGLLVVDGASGLGNGAVFPAGPLREPLGPQIDRADALVVVGQGRAGDAAARHARAAGCPVLAATLKVGDGAPDLAGRAVVGFCGIAKPDKFAQSLKEAGADLRELIAFPDHHLFSVADVARVLETAERLGSTPVTTEKDFVRLSGANDMIDRLRAASLVLPVVMEFEQTGELDAILRKALGPAQ